MKKIILICLLIKFNYGAYLKSMEKNLQKINAYNRVFNQFIHNQDNREIHNLIVLYLKSQSFLGKISPVGLLKGKILSNKLCGYNGYSCQGVSASKRLSTPQLQQNTLSCELSNEFTKAYSHSIGKLGTKLLLLNEEYIYLWDFTTNNALQIFVLDKKITPLKITDNKQFIIAICDSHYLIHNLSTGESHKLTDNRLVNNEKHTNYNYFLSNNEKIIVIYFKEKHFKYRLRLYPINSKKSFKEIAYDFGEIERNKIFTIEIQFLFSCDDQKIVVFFNHNRQSIISLYDLITDKREEIKNACSCLALHPIQSSIVAFSEHNIIVVYDFNSKKELSLKNDCFDVNSLYWSNDGNSIIIEGWFADQPYIEWNLVKQPPEHTIRSADYLKLYESNNTIGVYCKIHKLKFKKYAQLFKESKFTIQQIIFLTSLEKTIVKKKQFKINDYRKTMINSFEPPMQTMIYELLDIPNSKNFSDFF